MPPDKNQNINLLPGDLKRKQEVIKKVIANEAVSYTQPQNGLAGNIPPKKKSFINFWGRKGGNTVKSSNQNGLRLSTRQFATASKPNGRPMPAVNAPKPNFLSQSSTAIKPLAKKEPEKKPEPKKEPKENWWRKLFAKKSSPAPEKVKTEIKIPPLAPTALSKKEELPVQEKKTEPVMAKPAPEPPVRPVAPAPAPEPIAPDQSQPASAASALDVNLLSKEYAEVFKIRNQKSVFITWLVITAAAIGFAYLGIHLYQLKKSANIRQAGLINAELEKTIATYSSLEQEDALLLKKISSLRTLLDNHISISKFLQLLEAATTPEVTYTAIAASKEGLVTITALATDYTAVGRQLAILQEHTDWVKDAQITAAQLAKDNQAKSRGVGFDLMLKVDPSVFIDQEKISL